MVPGRCTRRGPNAAAAVGEAVFFTTFSAQGLEERTDGDSKQHRKVEQASRVHPVQAHLILLDLLKADADLERQLLLGQTEQAASTPQSAARSQP